MDSTLENKVINVTEQPVTNPFLSNWIKFLENPFDFVDNFSYKLFSRFEINVFRSDLKLRKTIFRGVIFACLMWIVIGFDSSAVQLDMFFLNLPKFLFKEITWNQLKTLFWSNYGKGVHWSAFVIYGLMFVGLSKYYNKKLNVFKSRNIVLSLGFTFLSIGLFEHFWHVSYYVFQEQHWILSWLWPQFRVLFQTLGLSLLGVFVIILVSLKHKNLYHLFNFRNKEYYWQPETNMPYLKLNFDGLSFIFLLITFFSICLWWFYPFPTQQISVPVETVEGVVLWTSSKFFPQTVYTVETNLLDNINAGNQFWIRNDLLHLVNTVCKVFYTLTIYNVAKLKRGKNEV